MKKLKYQLTTKVFTKIIENKILVLQKNDTKIVSFPSKAYTILLAKQLKITNLIPFSSFKFPLSLFAFSNYLDLQAYLFVINKNNRSLSSIVFTKIKSNIIVKNTEHLKAFDSKQTFLNFSKLFNSNILLLKTLKMFN
jgi:hypothetical protein